MDIFEMLKKDHKEATHLFEQLSGSQRKGKDKDRLFQELKQALDTHASIEEKLLYPALREASETRDMALESAEEHRIVKQLLEELAESDQDEQWEAKLKVLQESVEHHVQEEEKELFKKAQKVLSKDRIKELGERAKEQKETEMTRH